MPIRLFFSGSIWLVAALTYRRQRQAEAVAGEARQALQASEERYRTLVEHSLVGVYLIQGDRLLSCCANGRSLSGSWL